VGAKKSSSEIKNISGSGPKILGDATINTENYGGKGRFQA